MGIKKLLEQARADQIKVSHLYDVLVSSLTSIVVLYQKVDGSKEPLLTRGPNKSNKYVAVFTDLDATKEVKVKQPEQLELMEEPILPFLMKIYRSNVDGLMINPGQPSRCYMGKKELLEWLVEYSVQKLSKMEGAWIPTKNDNMLLVEHQKKQFTVAIYSEWNDAQHMCKHSGGMPKMHTWEQIFQKAKKVGAKSLFLNFNLADQYYLRPEHTDIIWNGPHKGYQEKKAVSHLFLGDSLKSVETLMPEQKSKDKPQSPPTTQDRAPATSPTTPKLQKEKVQEPAEEKAVENIVENKAEFEVKKATNYPKQRVNPYSLKSQKKDELDIYIGGKSDSKQQELEEKTAVEKKVAPPSQTSESIPNQGLEKDVARGLEKLEKATVDGQGMANGWEVCQVLAEISRIWVIVDADGNMVILAGQDQSPIVDFFSSDVHAKRLISEAQSSNPNLPMMRAQLVSTKKLYRALAPRQPIVWINRGSPAAWTSVMGDTLPYVMQLMSQLQK